MKLAKFVQRWMTHVAFAASLLVIGVNTSFGADRIVLKDGTVIEGEIVREDAGIIWMDVLVSGLKQQRMLLPSEVGTVERQVKASPPAEKPETRQVVETDSAVVNKNSDSSRAKTPRAMVMTMGDKTRGNDMVGIYMTAYSIQEMLPVIEKEIGNDGTGVLVLRINSGGGYTMEVPKLSDMIELELKPKFRVVAWIEFATSAAAMTAHACEEIYFTTRGEYGSCTEFAGSADRPTEGFGLQQILFKGEKWSDRGKHNRLIMRAMQIQQPLSATIGADGTVNWFPDATSGEIVVNRENEILSFNSLEAERVKFSRGTADTLEELTKLMGYQELDWVGEKKVGIAWPVSKAEEFQIDFREKTRNGENSMRTIYAKYQRSVAAAAQEQDRTVRGGYVGTAKQELEKLEAIVRNNPRIALINWGGIDPFKEMIREQRELLRDLMR
jgi:hypothetical protein